MNFHDLLTGIIHIPLNGLNPEITKIVKDAAKAVPGALYVCIKGISGDGHDHISKAVENGAAALLTEHDADLPAGIAAARIESSRHAMNFLCRSFYGDPLKNINVTGITGTKGKTSTTYFLEGIYMAAGKICGTIGTAGIRINGHHIAFKSATSTTPDTIDLYEIFSLMKNEGVTDIAMEVTSHALALDKVSAVSFNQAIFTNLTRDHFDFHENSENYFEAKSRLFKLCKTGIINVDDDSSARLREISPCGFITYGIEKDCEYRAENINYSINGTSFDVRLDGAKYNFFLPIPGGFSVYNALGAIASAHSSGISPDTIISGLKSVACIPGRIQSVPNPRGIGVIVDYAHTPDGLEKVINAVRPFTTGKVITMFGCGGDRDRGKRPIMGKIASELSDFCVVTSDNPRSEEPMSIISEILPGMAGNCKYIAEPDRKKAIFEAINLAKPGDTVILAGKGHEDYQEFENKRRVPFDDRLIALEALGEIGEII